MQIITTHKNTDFDALASMVAATLLYPGAVAVCPKSVNPNVKTFLGVHKTSFNMVLPDEVDFSEVDRLIVVDTNRWSRLERMESLKKRNDIKIHIWDHHLNGCDIDAEWKCIQDTGAAISILAKEMKKRNISLSPIYATLFLIGLYEDTGHLTFPSTKPDDAYAAGYLIEKGADLKIAGLFLNPPYAKAQKDILFEMMQRTEKIDINGQSISLITLPLEGHVEMLSMVVHMYRKIINVDAAFVIFTKNNGNCMIIGRSDIPGIDVGAIMRNLGGGGHPNAGAAMIRNKCGEPGHLKEKILEMIRGNQAVSIKVADLMSFPITTVSPETPMREVRMKMEKKGIKGAPVVDEHGKLMGIVSRSDFKRVKKESHWDRPVKAFMTRNAKFITPADTPGLAAKIMATHDIGHLPVVKDEKVIGIITRSDTLLYFYDMLPD